MYFQRLVCTILTLLIILMMGIMVRASSPDIWTVIANDPMLDGRDPSLADVAQLAYRYDSAKDELWFRLTLFGTPNDKAFGVNIVFDTGADESSKMNWWGGNKGFKFDKLLTVWVTRSATGYQGTIGVADAAGAKAKNFNNLVQNDVQFRIEGDSIFVGAKRTDITDKMKLSVVAAVGSNERWNDDVPNVRSAVIDLTAPKPTRGLREIDLNRNNLRFAANYRTLSENQPPRIVNKGTGSDALILIPGVYSGDEAFASFIARNQTRYKFFVVTPAGLDGTPARPLPPESTSYGELSWTRQLERDVLDLIKKQKLIKPVLITHGFPGSIAAEEIAIRHPEMIAGIIDVAVMPTRFFPSPKDPLGKTAGTPAERVYLVNALAQKWFRFVTSETWETNNYRAEMLTIDPIRGERVREQIESVPLEVKIRYLCESMAADHTGDYEHLAVPILALIPGFDQKFIADPAFGYYKSGFQDSWQAYSKYSNVQLVTVPNARTLMLDEQPKTVDEAIASFVRARK